MIRVGGRVPRGGGVCPGHVCPGGGVCPGTGVCRGGGGRCPLGPEADTPSLVDRMTDRCKNITLDRCKNITLPQLRCGR